MKKLLKNHLFMTILIAVLLVGMIPVAYAAVFYGDYTDSAKVYDYGSCPSMQGLAVGSQMLYTIKINSSETQATISMTDKDSGSTTRLYNADAGSYYFTGFGHANDMAVWGIGGYSHIFVTSTEEGSSAITRLKRSGNNLSKVASYSLSYNGTPTCATAFDIMDVSDGKIHFITKLGQTVYTGSVDVNATSADIPLTKLCIISKERVIIKGETLDLSDWVNQGFGYHDNTLFVPISGPDGELNRSVVCVYNLDNVVPGSTLYPTESVAFRVTSGAYSALFEIESVDICSGDDKLYFNTNRRKTNSDTNHDGVSSFDGYTFSKIPYNADDTKHFIARFFPNGGTGTMADLRVCNGVSTPLSKNTFTRTGYTFTGWAAHRVAQDQWYYTNGTDSGWYAEGSQPSGWYLYIYTDAQKVANTTGIHKDVAEFYAQWKRNANYTVTWSVNGVTTTESYAEGETPSFKGSTAKASNGCTSYTFTGWDKAITPVTANVTYTAQYSASTNHTLVTVPGKAATCTQTGLTDGVKCSACGYVQTAQQTIPAAGHSYTAVVTEPTCTQKGYTTYTCACGDSYIDNPVDAKGHSYKAVVTAPTCTEKGYTTYTCSVCRHSYVADEVAAKGHSYKAVVTDPTCTEKGYTTYTCACGDSYVADEVAANGHRYKAVVTDPTCTEKGYTTYTCADCDHSYIDDVVAATGHSFVDGACHCGEEDPTYIDPSVPYYLVGDMNNWDETATVMTGEGIVSVTMELPQGSYRFKIHRSYLEYGNDGIIANTTANTSESGWLMTTTAGFCTLNASGGTYRFTFNTETCMLVVTRLGDETEDAPIVNGTITLKSMSLSLKDEIVYNLYFETQNINVGAENMGLIVWDQMPAQPIINGGGTVIEGATYLPDSGRYGISSMGIPAKNMGDVKYMVVYARLADGTYVYSRVLQYSAKTYCLNRVHNSTDEKMRALCVSLMNYGAEAQKYFAATTDYTYTELMNVGFEDYQYLVQPYSSGLLNQPVAVDTSKVGIFGAKANGFTGRSASMSADGTFALNYYFTTSQAVDKVTFYYWTAEQYAAVSELTMDNASGSKTMVATQNANQFWANVDGIAAKEMDQTVYACGVYEVDGELYSTGVIAYSMAKYCIGKAETVCDIQNFAKAMTVYGYHAKSYFGI